MLESYRLVEDPGCIDYEKVAAEGILAWLIDIDGNITAHHTPYIEKDLTRRMKEMGFAEYFKRNAIISNHKDAEYVLNIADMFSEQTETDTLAYCLGMGFPPKPNPTMALKAIEKLGIQPNEAAGMGDRVHSDIKHAYKGKLGAAFLTKRIGKKDFFMAPAVRAIEFARVKFDLITGKAVLYNDDDYPLDVA